MDENLVGEISIISNGNINEKERNQMIFDQIADLERKKQGEGGGGDAKDKIIDCCTKLNLDRSQNDDAIKNLLDGNVIYNSNLCYKLKKNFEGTNTDSYIAHNETETPLNIAKPKISLKKKFNPLKTKFIDDFESVKESFSEINSFKMEMMQPNTDISESIDSSERLIKQLQDEIIFAREELTNENNKIKCVLDQSVMGLFVQIQSVIVIENQRMIASCQLMRKKPIVTVAKFIMTKKIF